ncbi:ferredoxin--NADP(+) reductase [Kaistia sp. 32K]|uniref:ferredoxin--NADP reductase n=1 Tax=Kaistia sp. 32K TaxID=2795690 RepID=UPI0019161CEB|nr:ferredoxin--NADP reductase [Kaistia sp. 32K]BCP53938.1 ferredoxin--NADP(+) reductase [Kaistia sp. 32K]
MSNFYEETVVDIHHWTDSLFSFRTTRNAAFRFQSGQFTMMGLEVEGRPLTRAYSIVSSHYDDELEFFSIKVPHGPLTSKLQHVNKGDRVLVGKKPVGTLLYDNLEPGKRLWLLSTGTGLAPFLSIIRDPETYERYEKVILVHGVRQTAELAYGDFIRDQLPSDEFLGEQVTEKLVYYPTVTREPYVNRGRVTDLIVSGQMFNDLGMPPLDAEIDRVMLCGSPAMLKDCRDILVERGFAEGSQNKAGQFVIEKAFVEK